MLTLPDTPFAFAFPGAGTAPSAAEQAWADRFAAWMRPPLQAASDMAEADLVAAVDPERFATLGPLAQQCFTFAFGLGIADVVLAAGARPVGIAGHSLGVYAAAVASGALIPADGLTLLVAAFRLAADACRGREPAMLAITGPVDVDLAVRQAGGQSLRVVIRNGAFSAVVAGTTGDAVALETAVRGVPGVRVTWLDREVAYHHPDFLAGAARALRDVAVGLAWRDPSVPVVSSIDGALCRTADDVATFLVANLAHPIDWQPVLAKLAGLGACGILECGPGDSLARIGRGCEPSLEVRTVRRWARREAG